MESFNQFYTTYQEFFQSQQFIISSYQENRPSAKVLQLGGSLYWFDYYQEYFCCEG